MRFDRKNIERLEKLARVELGDEEREKLAGHLERILRLVEILSRVDTGDVETGGERRDPGRLREDVPAPGLPGGIVSDCAPDAADGFYRVPRVIDRREDG